MVGIIYSNGENTYSKHRIHILNTLNTEVFYRAGSCKRQTLKGLWQ